MKNQTYLIAAICIVSVIILACLNIQDQNQSSVLFKKHRIRKDASRHSNKLTFVELEESKNHLQLSDHIQDIIVKKHNELRNKVASGQQSGLPEAADMAELAWDQSLASGAQQWSDGLSNSFSHSQSGGAYGENLAMKGYFTDMNEDGIKDMIQAWYDEVNQFSPGEVGNFTGGASGHFTQVIWAKSTKVGCGVTLDQGSLWMCCRYTPAGNYYGESIYEQGTSCSDCSGSDCDDTYTSLCTNSENQPVSEPEAQPIAQSDSSSGIQKCATSESLEKYNGNEYCCNSSWNCCPVYATFNPNGQCQCIPGAQFDGWSGCEPV